MRSALYEWPFTMHLLWEFRCIIDVLLKGIMGLMVAGDFATVTMHFPCRPVNYTLAEHMQFWADMLLRKLQEYFWLLT